MTGFKLEVRAQGETEILLRRQFKAPKALVYRCFTDEKLLPQWLGCGMGKTVLCVCAHKIGEVWRHQMDMGERGLFDTFGQLLEVEPESRLVRSYVYNVPVIREHICTETATFEEKDGLTSLTVTIRHLNRESRDGHLNSGLEFGAGASYDSLEKLLEGGIS